MCSGLPDGHSFVYHGEQKTYAEARRQCQAEGGNLVVVNSADKQDWLNKLKTGKMIGESTHRILGHSHCGLEQTRIET